MEVFDINTRRLWLLRAFGRNPMLRGSDRVEAAVTALAIIFVALLIPVAGAVGTAVHEGQVTHRMEALTHRHEVTADVTADSVTAADPYTAGALTSVRWTIGAATHTGTVRSREWKKAGDKMEIWVDDSGLLSPPPPDPADPALAAVVMALSVWGGAAFAAAGFVTFVRRHLDRLRYASWQREFQQLPENRGRRRNHW